MIHGLYVLDTMAWGKRTKMDRDFLSSAAIMDCKSLTHSSRPNRVTNWSGGLGDWWSRTKQHGCNELSLHLELQKS